MNAVILTFVLVVLALSWRGLTSWVCLQRCLHFFGPLAPLLQWYTILFLGIGALVVRTFWDIVKFEYIRFNFLDNAGDIMDPHFIPDLSDNERDALLITPWLKTFSLLAPAAGMLAALIVAQHTYAIAVASARRTQQKWESTRGDEMRSSRPLRWMMDKETDMVLLVVAMPIVFILMAMRAEIRIWAVMTGSAFLPYYEQGGTLQDWEAVKAAELTVYTEDIEMCGCFVYMTIFCFGRLCTSYLRNAPQQYQNALKFAGLQGVYLYVIFGALRAIANMAVAIASDSDQYASIVTVLQQKVLVQIQPVFTVATLLCVYNIIVICGMTDIKNHLGNANLKFQGVRFLVLVAQIQLMVLQGLTKGSQLYAHLEKLPPPYADMVHSWHFSKYRAMLVHSALLNFECLLVVVFQRCAWRPGREWGYSGDVAAARELRGDGLWTLEQSLLHAG